MKRILILIPVIAIGLWANEETQALDSKEETHKGNWISWRGPLQTGVSLETYKNWSFDPKPVWTFDMAGRGNPVIYKGRLYSWGYRGKGADLEEVVTAHDEKTGEVIWQRSTHDFLSDTIYNRYSIGSVGIDPETENIYVATTYGLVTCYDKEGKQLWQHSMVERFGRLTFPNGRAGQPIIDGDIVVIRGVTSYWGADGPARDRFFGFDKNSGDLVWSSTPGVGPPFLSDSSMSSPWVETRGNKRVFFAGTGCGNIVCVNIRDGKPLWRYQVSKGGVNSSPLVLGDTLIGIHGAENLDSTESGRMFAFQMPKDFDHSGGEVDAEQGGAPRLPQDVEIWRAKLEMFTSSPLLDSGRVYQVTKTGSLVCLDALTGEIQWEKKLANEQIHASPAMADGILYVPVYPGKLFVIKPGDKDAEILHEIELEGNCLGSPTICNGRVYVHTTEKLYCFKMNYDSIAWNPIPESKLPVAGTAASIQAIPSDVLLSPGQSIQIKTREVDADGNLVKEHDTTSVSWEKFIPPTAKVKVKMDASLENGSITAGADAGISAGMFKGTDQGLTAFVRGRVLPNLPYTEDFEGFDLTVDHEVDKVKFAYPPLPWIGGRLKWEVRELDGNKVLVKTLDRILFQRSVTYLASPELKNYTFQADVMTDGNRRVKSVVGLINQRYLITLVGPANIMEVSSNQERLKESVPFPVSANQWYTLKTRVDVNEDGSGTVRGKAWKKGTPEPEAWTIEVKHAVAHTNGSPGVFGFSPQSKMPVFIDNLSINAN
jgi:outer membrane protein assembly factor BamB